MDIHFYCFGGKNRDKNGRKQVGGSFGVIFAAWAVKMVMKIPALSTSGSGTGGGDGLRIGRDA